MEVTCDRCKVSTEYFFEWPHQNDAIILCDECCRNLLLRAIDDEQVDLDYIESFAHATL